MFKGMIKKWKGGRKSANVDDRRATSGSRGDSMPFMRTMMILYRKKLVEQSEQMTLHMEVLPACRVV